MLQNTSASFDSESQRLICFQRIKPNVSIHLWECKYKSVKTNLGAAEGPWPGGPDCLSACRIAPPHKSVLNEAFVTERSLGQQRLPSLVVCLSGQTGFSWIILFSSCGGSSQPVTSVLVYCVNTWSCSWLWSAHDWIKGMTKREKYQQNTILCNTVF